MIIYALLFFTALAMLRFLNCFYCSRFVTTRPLKSH